MLNLLLLLRDIIQLRRGPQDMPYSTSLLAAVCVASLTLQLGIAYLMGIEGDTLAAGIIGLIINLGFLYLILTLRGFATRFVQTATALLCCTIVFSIITVPIVFLIGTRPMTPEQMSPLQALLGLLSLPIVIWKLIVDAHILRHSLAIPFVGGVGVAILWIIAEYAIGSLIHTQAGVP